MSDPVVIFSSCENDRQTNDGIYNGGTKLQNLWAKLLIQHGHEAYVCTYTGQHQEWLVNHAPYISIPQAQEMIHAGRPIRVMTTWIVSELALTLAPKPYYFDAEIAHTACGAHFQAITRWLPQLAKIGTHSRTQQAWYMATFGITPDYIQEWSDNTLFKPDLARREAGLIGYMYEGPQTEAHINVIQKATIAAGLNLRFWMVKGAEREVIEQMQRCDVFLGMNTGKHPLYGEGSPRSQQEAAHCGAVLISFMCHGNREYITDGYTGYLVPNQRPDLMAERLIHVMRHEAEREGVRARGIDFAMNAFSQGERRYLQIKEYLDL